MNKRGFAALCATAGYARPVTLAQRKEFFAAYTPPKKTDFILFAACELRTL